METLEPENSRQESAGIEQRKIRVFIVSRFSLLGRVLQLLLEQDRDIEVLGYADTAGESLAAVEAVHPDLVVVEMDARVDEEVDLLKMLKAASPESRLVVISATPIEEGYRRMSQVGVAGYLPDVTNPEHFAAMLRSVYAGEIGAAFALPGPWTAAPAPAQRLGKDIPALTPREAAIVRGIAEGLSDKQIGLQLSMAVSTVRIHIRSVYQKLGLRNRAHAAAYAGANGLAENPSPSSASTWAPERAQRKEPAGSLLLRSPTSAAHFLT
ncbi:MAG TPA: response regulator transcription factor [bacterium]|nr:response regulator transcription factor [bacterium]